MTINKQPRWHSKTQWRCHALQHAGVFIWVDELILLLLCCALLRGLGCIYLSRKLATTPELSKTSTRDPKQLSYSWRAPSETQTQNTVLGKSLSTTQCLGHSAELDSHPLHQDLVAIQHAQYAAQRPCAGSTPRRWRIWDASAPQWIYNTQSTGGKLI